MSDFPREGVLISAAKGLFLAREVNGIVTVTPPAISTSDMCSGMAPGDRQESSRS
jgi:hypothetical protein